MATKLTPAEQINAAARLHVKALDRMKTLEKALKDAAEVQSEHQRLQTQTAHYLEVMSGKTELDPEIVTPPGKSTITTPAAVAVKS